MSCNQRFNSFAPRVAREGRCRFADGLFGLVNKEQTSRFKRRPREFAERFFVFLAGLTIRTAFVGKGEPSGIVEIVKHVVE